MPGCHLLIWLMQTGNVPEEGRISVKSFKRSFFENGAIEFKIANDEVEQEKIWKARRGASPSITIYGSKKLNEDISVPRSCLPKALEEIYNIGSRYDLVVPCFGHAWRCAQQACKCYG